MEEGGVHIRCALASALACKTSRGTIWVRGEQTAGVLRRAPPARLVLILIRPFALKGSISQQFSDLFLFIPASSRADSLIDRTQTLTGLCKMVYLDLF